jgi:hypothetical protein
MSFAWVPAGSVMAVAAVLLLRLGWGQTERAPLLLGAAWAMLLLGVASGAAGHGAWGVAIVALAAMLCAGLCLAAEAVTAPPDKAHGRRSHGAAGPVPLHLGRRMLTFVLTVPLSLSVSLVMALAARALIAAGGGAEADANVATLFLTPTLWGLFAFALMMVSRRSAQIAMLGVPTAVAGLCLLWGGVS